MQICKKHPSCCAGPSTLTRPAQAASSLAFANLWPSTLETGRPPGQHPSRELAWEEPEDPVSDALEGLLGLPVHGSQDLGEHPQEGQPEAQELVCEAVVVSIVPEMQAKGTQESPNPVKQAPGKVEQAPGQPERPA